MNVWAENDGYFLARFGWWTGHLLLAIKEVSLVQEDYYAKQIILEGGGESLGVNAKGHDTWMLVISGADKHSSMIPHHHF